MDKKYHKVVFYFISHWIRVTSRDNKTVCK